MDEILIHLPRHMVAELADGRAHFYNRLFVALTEAGARARIVRRQRGNPPPDPEDGNFHFIHQACHVQGNVLNTGLAYVMPFWYADPRGIYAESSMADAVFDAGAVPARPAQGFLERTHRRLAGNRLSRYRQKAEVTRLPEGAIAVFLQGPSDILDRARLATSAEMLEAVMAGAGGRPVVVKPHPLGVEPEVTKLLRRLGRRNRNLFVTDANVHDILASAALTVSISSAVALEGMIHGRPAILFGRADFHHCAVTLARPKGFATAMEEALARDWPFARFLYWFLFENMLNTGHDSFAPRLLDRLRRQAGGLARFGIPEG